MSDGHRKLHALLMSGRAKVQDVANQCGVARPLVVAWASGEHNPDPVSRAVLELDFKIPAPAWHSAG